MKKSPELHLNLERIDIADIPADDKALQSWIFAQFRKKERFIMNLPIIFYFKVQIINGYSKLGWIATSSHTYISYKVWYWHTSGPK